MADSSTGGGAVVPVGTGHKVLLRTKPQSQRKEFKLKETSRLKSHKSFSGSDFPQLRESVPSLGFLLPFGQAGGCGESALQIVSTGYGFTVYASSATSSPHRRTLRARVIRSGGLLGMIAVLLRLSSILHVIFLGRAFLPTVSISSRMMRAARVLSVEADTMYALTWARAF